jgi:cyclin T
LFYSSEAHVCVFHNTPIQTIATACLFLAGKVEETPKKLRDVLAATFKLRNNGIELRQDSHQYAELKERVLVAERVLLQAISFDLSIDHPFRHIVSFIKSLPKDSLPKDKQQNFAQVSWNFCNDRYVTQAT